MTIPYYPITMIKDVLTDIPKLSLPAGYVLRFYRRGEEDSWAKVATAAGEFERKEAALAHFQNEFGPHISEVEQRCIFLETEQGEIIGTATAWYNREFRNGDYGRLHWVSIRPEFQGKKLAKPLVAKAIEVLASRHYKAYLTSQTTSYKAVKIYLDFGFEPLIDRETCQTAWRLLAELLQHPKLDNHLG